MRKWLDSKAGATYLAEIPNTTLCVKKDCIELIYKMDRGLYIVINVMRANATELMLLAEWGDYFDRLKNPDAQMPQIRKTCPTLYKVLIGEDADGIGYAKAASGSKGLVLSHKVEKFKPLFCCITDEMMEDFQKLVNKNLDIYNELRDNPPFPAWKDGLADLWNS